MKACPYCSEQIQDTAVKCRFCGEYLAGLPGPAAAPSGAPASSPPASSPPPGAHHYAPPPQVSFQRVVGPDPGVAAILELIPGIFLQTFGIGHIYAGDVGTGLILMFTYWLLTAVNFALTFVAIGILTWPATFLLFAILSTMAASNKAKAARQVVI